MSALHNLAIYEHHPQIVYPVKHMVTPFTPVAEWPNPITTLLQAEVLTLPQALLTVALKQHQHILNLRTVTPTDKTIVLHLLLYEHAKR
jgi:glycyl-tRNA synthetase beta subunit